MTTILTVGDDNTAEDILECLRNLADSAAKVDAELMRMHDMGERQAVSTLRIRGDRLADQIDGLCAEMAGRGEA